jgi:predicted kinase
MVKRNPLYQINANLLMDDYYAKLKKYLKEGFSVVDDNLNSTADDRKRVLAIPKSLKTGNVRIVHFDVPLATCLKWNKQRKYPAPSASVQIAHGIFTRNQPTASEGTLLRVRPVEGQVDMWEVER